MKSAATPRALTLSEEINLCRDELPAAAGEITEERRSKPRIKFLFPTRAWGVDAGGKDFDIDCTLENVSSTGLYLRLPRRVASDAQLKVLITFSHNMGGGATALLECETLRNEPQPDGQHGLAMRVKSCHFI
jgi:PilZ domain-containing protein